MKNWQKLLRKAERALERGRVSEALQLCDQAAFENEESRYSAGLMRGSILLELGDAVGALSAFESLAKPESQDSEVDCARGMALFELARFPEAEAALRSAVRGGPHLAKAFHTLGLIAEFKGTGEEVRWFREARSLEPTRFGHRVQLSNAEFREMVEEAVAELPSDFVEIVEEIPIVVSELPIVNELNQLQPPISPLSLAMMVGAVRVEHGPADDLEPILFLFKRNIERAFPDPEEMKSATRRAIIRHFAEALGFTQ